MARWRGAGSACCCTRHDALPLPELQLANGAFQPAQPRLEDAFIDLLGGRPRRGVLSLAAGCGEAELPQGLPEAVIERHLTKRFRRFRRHR